MRAVMAGKDECHDHLRWFRSLPLWIETPGFRVVHACWNAAAVEALRNLPRPLTDASLAQLDDRTKPLRRAADLLLTVVRLELPGDLYVLTSRGVPLNWMRAKWWIPAAGRSYDDLAFPDLDVCPRISRS